MQAPGSHLQSFTGLRVMIVEDIAVVAFELQRHLEKMGLSVCGVAAACETAVALAEKTQPQVVLMDVRLSGSRDGIETARLILQNMAVPIVFLTAASDAATLQKAKDVEGYGYVLKPIDPAQLHATLEMVLHRFDMTQRLHHNEVALQKAVRARDNIRAIVAHDLNSLLTGMLLDLQRIERKHPEGLVSRSLRLGQQMACLIHDLQDLDSMERGELPLQLSDTNLRELLAAAIDNALPIAGRKACELRLLCDEDYHINIDPARISQVLNNLVNNAVKFSPSQGEIVVRAQRQDDGCIALSVQDQGPGIAEEHRNHVFEQHWQSQPGHMGGRGLGLYIARGIVESHGGRIWVEGAEGVGSKFTVALPDRGTGLGEPPR